jgi:hypothetical protein
MYITNQFYSTHTHSETSRKKANNEESDSHKTHAQFTRPVCTDSNPRKKKKETKMQFLYQPPVLSP